MLHHAEEERTHAAPRLPGEKNPRETWLFDAVCFARKLSVVKQASLTYSSIQTSMKGVNSPHFTRTGTGQHEFRRHCILMYIYIIYIILSKHSMQPRPRSIIESTSISLQGLISIPHRQLTNLAARHLEKASEDLSQCSLHVNLFNCEVGSFF